MDINFLGKYSHLALGIFTAMALVGFIVYQQYQKNQTMIEQDLVRLRHLMRTTPMQLPPPAAVPPRSSMPPFSNLPIDLPAYGQPTQKAPMQLPPDMMPISDNIRDEKAARSSRMEQMMQERLGAAAATSPAVSDPTPPYAPASRGGNSNIPSVLPPQEDPAEINWDFSQFANPMEREWSGQGLK